jgi:hypothetical protein
MYSNKNPLETSLSLFPENEALIRPLKLKHFLAYLASIFTYPPFLNVWIFAIVYQGPVL